ncbi:hypothetical protein PHMEG_00017327 [Phytophthora megakarya]|uniref:M96 mating-specific protein n=1 Tax=Phytophthora megakarya TaxID=4795 RepID=A0A225VY70_9STRA|nr:hypothetical protein PHMEG_00017327 [Phytophthora megakarya]
MEALDHMQPVASHSPTQTQPLHPSKNVPRQRKRSNRATPSWIKRRDELQSLRQQTQEMETRVAFLEMNRENVTVDTLQNRQRVKTMAMVEKKRHYAAQDENEQLKRKLRRVMSLKTAFQTVLSDTELQEAAVLLNEESLQIEMRTRHFNFGVFDVLERRMDNRFFEMEESFRLMQQPMATTDTNTIETNFVGAVEFVRLQLLPFPNDAVSTAMWAMITAGGFPDGEDSIVHRRSENVLAVNSHVTVRLESGSNIDIATSTVIKKFETAKGFAVLTEAISNWTGEDPHSGAWRHITQEGGCFAMCDYSSPGICQSRAMLRLDIDSQNGNYQQLACSSTIQEIVIPSFRELVDSRHQFVENAMFDFIRTKGAM